MVVIKKFDLLDFYLRVKLVKGMGYSLYGELVWLNDLLYIFLVCIVGIFVCVIGLVVLDFVVIGELVNLFVILLEILFEWYFYFVF